jgi:hypothetical protein
MTAFDLAASAMFADPNMAEDAQWISHESGGPSAIRVIRREPDTFESFGASAVTQGTAIFDVPVSQVPELARGDTIQIGDQTWTVIDVPRADSHRLFWTFPVGPA